MALRSVLCFGLIAGFGGWLAGQALRAAAGAGRQFESALAFYNQRQFDQAERALAPVLRRFPNNFQANELMGLVYAGKSNASQANTYLARAVQLNPGSADARMVLAANLAELGRDAEAEREFMRAVRLEPGSYDTNHNLGEFYIGANRLSAAIPYLAAAQRIRPSAPNNGYDLALAEIKTGQYAAAKKCLENLLARQAPGPNSADLHSLLATSDEHTGLYLDAVREDQLAARDDPSEANIFAYASELLLHHTLEAAEQVFQRGVELYPRSARMQVGYGIALYSRGVYSDAIESFCRAIDINPADPRPYAFLGKIYAVSPLQAADVTQRFARFAAFEPRNPQALYYYAMSLWKGSRTANQALDEGKVAKLLETVVSIRPQFAQARLQLGILYAQEQRWGDAIAQYRAAIRDQPRLADAHYRLAQALVRAGDRAQAQQEFQTFNRLHQQDVKENAKERAEVKQFVYTAGAPSAKP